MACPVLQQSDQGQPYPENYEELQESRGVSGNFVRLEGLRSHAGPRSTEP